MMIVHAITRLIVGGSQELVLLMCREQIQFGHDVTLVHGGRENAHVAMLDAAGAIPGLRLQQAPSMVPDPDEARDPAALAELESIIEEAKPAVVHTHTFKAGVLGRQAASRLSVPCVVHSVHGARFFEEQEQSQNDRVVAMERDAAQRCHRILPVSNALRERFIRTGIGQPAQYRTIHSGLDMKRFSGLADAGRRTREAFGIRPDEVVAGTLGRLDRMKGHRDLISGLQATFERCPKLRLLWVGDGPERGALASDLERRGLADRVVLTGMQPPHDVPRFVAAMDILAHPSYREGFPMALVQAMLAGRPVVAYDVDGIGELVDEGTTGHRIRKGDDAGMAAAIEALAGDAALRRRFGLAGKSAVRGRTDHRRMMREIQDVYREVLDGG